MIARSWRVVTLPRITDPRGDLTVIEGEHHAPFSIRRVYYVYDVPAGQARGGHAHRLLEQVIIAVAGSFEVVVDDGACREALTLNSPASGLYIPRLIWRELINFSAGAVCLTLASEHYSEADYFRDYSEFLLAARAGR